MVSKQDISQKTDVIYKLLPPDGGWGYLVAISCIIMNLVTIVPQTSFGLIYGKFLASLGDETTGTTLACGVFNTVQSFTGLAASFLLQKYSYRKVGLLGAVLYSLGAFAIIISTNLTQLVIGFGILEGLGFGLLMPASFSAFNCYFDKKMNLVMGVAQAVMVTGAIAFPPATAFLMQCLNYKWVVTLLAVLSLLNFPAMGILHPVKWHMKKVPVDGSVVEKNEVVHDKSKSFDDGVLSAQMKPLLSHNLEEEDQKISISTSLSRSLSKPRFSIVSLGDRISLTVVNDLEIGEDDTQVLTGCMDVSLLKDLKYLNISFGAALSYTADVAFFAIIPLILNNFNLDTDEIAFMMMVYFGSDLVSRILLSIVSALYKIRNRYIFLIGSFLSAVFRIAFVMANNYTWKILTLSVLGFLRCFIQTPLALVFSEEYNDAFPTAFSLYMVVCGFVSIILGLIMSSIKSVTQNDEMVVHVLTAAFLISSISWMVELFWNKVKSKKT